MKSQLVTRQHLRKNFMSDSQKLIIRLPKVLPEHGPILFPAKHLIVIDERSVLTIKPVDGHICGLTTANNKISAITNAAHEVCAYGFSQNHPAALVGSNVIVHNLVHYSVPTCVYMLQRLLIKKGVSPSYVNTIGVEHCSFQEITLTFCLQYESATQARTLLKRLKRYAGIVLKSPRSQSEKASKKVGFAGSGDSESWYINKTDHRSTRFYIKDRNQAGTYSSFESPEVAKKIYTLGQKLLRIEITLNSHYLISNGLDDPQAWRGAKGKAICEREFNWLRQLLKVDVDYRVNKPQKRHMEGLGEREQSVLDWYLKGKPVNRHSKLQSGEWKKSPIKRRIQERLRIDIDIPWKEHCRMAIPGLSGLLSLDRLVVPPAELRDHCHVLSTVKRKNRELKELAKAEIAAAEAKLAMQARAKGKRGVASRAAAPADSSVLQVLLAALREKGVELCFSTGADDGTTADISDLMG